jgi:hypothetical protein
MIIAVLSTILARKERNSFYSAQSYASFNGSIALKILVHNIYGTSAKQDTSTL